MEKDYGQTPARKNVSGNRVGISDAEVDEVLRKAKAQLAKDMGDQQVPEFKKMQPEEKQPERKKPELEKKQPEEKKPEPEKKQPEKKAEEKPRAAQKAPEQKVTAGRTTAGDSERKQAGTGEKTTGGKEVGTGKESIREKETKSGAGNYRVSETEKKDADFEVEDTVYIDNSAGQILQEKEKVSVGNIIGGFFEFIWTIVKLAAVVSIVVGVVGFLLTRNLMIRGRAGERQAVADMTISGAMLVNKDNELKKAKDWINQVHPEKLTMMADDDYILVARKIIVKPDNDKWAVILHGYNGKAEDIYDIAKHYADEDFNILMPDLRANGESEGSFMGMGWTDRLDVINWIDVILEENPSAQIVIHGVDVGADTALMLAGEPVKSSIKAIVAEGAYTSAWDVVKKEYAARYQWPAFPIVNMMNPVTKIWGGYSLKEADAVKQVKNTQIPILLIHGGQDTYATDDMTKELDEAISSAHEVLEIAAGVHEYCRYTETDTYYNGTFRFVDTYVK